MSMPYLTKYPNNVFSALKMYTRTNPIPLDPSSVFNTYADLQEYVAGPTSYAGQLVAVANGTVESTNGDKDYTFYVIRSDKSLQMIGSNLVFATLDLARAWVTKNTDAVVPGTLLTVLNGTAYDLYTINPDKTLRKASFDASTDLPELNWADLVGAPDATSDEIDTAVEFTQEFTVDEDGRITFGSGEAAEELAFMSDITWANVADKPELVNTIKVTGVASEVNVGEEAVDGDLVLGEAAAKVVVELIPDAPTDEEKAAIPTLEAVKAYADSRIAANDAMVFKGTLANGATLPAAEAGHAYKVSEAGTIGGFAVELGDMIICTVDGTAENTPANWIVVQANIDGAVVGPTESVTGHIAVFDGATGKVVKDSGFTIKTSVPENAVFTDTTYDVFSTEADGLVPAPADAAENKFLNAAGQWIEETVYTIFATEVDGLVPAPTAEEVAKDNMFLTADGRWAEPENTTYEVMTGATASTAGTEGLVPASQAGDQGKFLRADGTWAQETTYGVFAKGTNGLVPAPVDGQEAMFLAGDGTWKAQTEYPTFVTDVDGLVPAPTAEEAAKDNMFLTADGTWAEPKDTTYETFAVAKDGLVPAPQAAEEDAFLNAAGEWVVPADTFMDVKAAEAGKVAVGVASATELEYADVAGLKLGGFAKTDATGAVAATDTIADAFSKVENTMDTHVHGNITRDGKLTGVVNKVVVTGADGTIQGSEFSVGGAALPETATDKVLATEAAVKAYADSLLGANDAMVLKGGIAGGAEGAYGALTPAADAGHAYKVTTAGMINGIAVEPGDMVICTVDGTESATAGNYTTVANSWIVIQSNTDVFVGATATTAGTTGLVPAPQAAEEGKFLAADGTWKEIDTDVITNNSVTNDKLATMAGKTIKGNDADATGAAKDLTAAEVRTIINVEDGANNYVHPTQAAAAAAFVKVGNDEAGHVVIGEAVTGEDIAALNPYGVFNTEANGLVPAPTAADANKFLNAAGAWTELTVMTGATANAAGTAGLVPAPKAGEQARALMGDGTYKTFVYVGAEEPGDELAVGGIWFKELAEGEVIEF